MELAAAPPVRPPEDIFTTTFERLLPFKIRQVLLVASLYDSFILEEDGRLTALLNRAYKERDLGYVPALHRAGGGQAALEAIAATAFDLVIVVMRLGDMDPFTFAERARAIRPGLPLILLAFNTPELPRLLESERISMVDRVFVWEGDGKLLPGIIQYVEDRQNAATDSDLIGVQNLLLVEDSPIFYSFYLPLLYDELWDQTDQLLREDLSYTQRTQRQRSRPKIHLASTYEEAVAIVERFRGRLLGVVSDGRFPREGRPDEQAGLALIRRVRREAPDLPVVVQSSEPISPAEIQELGFFLVDKNSRTLLSDLRQLFREHFGFGELRLRDRAGRDLPAIPNLPALQASLDGIPDETLHELVSRGGLRRWLLARTEFDLARRVEAIAGEGDTAPAALRDRLRQAWNAHLVESQLGSIIRYSRHGYESHCRFLRLGSGSIGGKARGLAFITRLLSRYPLDRLFPDVHLSIPKTIVVGTDVFDQFIAQNHLLEFAVNEPSDRQVASRFIQADLPATLVGDLRALIRHVKVPLAVRSSSLLEDALYQPFAGIYATKMIPNNHLDTDNRFRDLANAIKLVWASTFFRTAKAYIESTNHRIEEEKMAVVIQEVVGIPYRERFYPHFSGVACSHNYYPVGYARPQDGIAMTALGLGKTVVDGGTALRFCPAYPRILPQFGTIKDMLANSQREFYAIGMKETFSKAYDDEDQFLVHLPLKDAEKDGTLTWLASTFSPRDDRVFDGIHHQGARIVTFAHVLKSEVFPLSRILQFLLRLAEDAMGCPIEMEFAVTLGAPNPLPAHFGLLQVRPMVVSDEQVDLDLGGIAPDRILCASGKVLGNGTLKEITDIVYVRPETFSAAQTPLIAGQVDRLNGELRAANRSCLLIGPGRWGSSDPWLGIPVTWGQINRARAVVEVALPGMNVDPSQGSHFFQNITSLRVGYFTVPLDTPGALVDWAWLNGQAAVAETELLRHVRLDQPLEIRIDGRTGTGVILKPGN